MPESIFAEEWRDCLRAHYTVVVRNNDHITERTLRTVMIEAGFTEDALRQLYIRATAHVDDVDGDFVPDMEFIEGKAEAVAQAPAEASVAVVVPAIALPQEVIEAQIVEESVAMDEAAEAETEVAEEDADEAEQGDAEDQDEADDSSPKAEPDATQMSLF